MDKAKFKSTFLQFIEQDVDGVSLEKKIKVMRKWIREYEQSNCVVNSEFPIEDSMKIGQLVRISINRIVEANLLSEDKIRLLQDEKYCKNTFDIHYPFLKRVESDRSLSDQRRVNGYERYWVKVITINGVKYFLCNDWYERNKPKFIKWVKEIEQGMHLSR